MWSLDCTTDTSVAQRFARKVELVEPKIWSEIEHTSSVLDKQATHECQSSARRRCADMCTPSANSTRTFGFFAAVAEAAAMTNPICAQTLQRTKFIRGCRCYARTLPAERAAAVRQLARSGRGSTVPRYPWYRIRGRGERGSIRYGCIVCFSSWVLFYLS